MRHRQRRCASRQVLRGSRRSPIYEIGQHAARARAVTVAELSTSESGHMRRGEAPRPTATAALRTAGEKASARRARSQITDTPRDGQQHPATGKPAAPTRRGPRGRPDCRPECQRRADGACAADPLERPRPRLRRATSRLVAERAPISESDRTASGSVEVTLNAPKGAPLDLGARSVAGSAGRDDARP